jgi:crotonobetainyl-CoA:carnitine CoA-transferase CaiB-like acyl-CoA transferase
MHLVSPPERTRDSASLATLAAHPTPSALPGLPERLDALGSAPALDWAASGAMALCGEPDEPPLAAPAAFATAAAQAIQRLAALCEGPARSRLLALDGPALLAERAAALGLERAGRTSAGGSCRLLHTASVSIALQLVREDDVGLLEAWLETPRAADAEPWEFVGAVVAGRDGRGLAERGRSIGLAVAASEPPPATAPPWVRIEALGARSAERSRPRVIDLSSLWAGPLCGQLLGLAGAEVIKVESTSRPDGARRGPARFFDLLNAGKASVALDFGSPDGRRALAALLASADIVIEASRPRALEQLGIDAAACVRARPGTTWISLTGYGRAAPGRNWIAFGDDAAVAAGTTAALRAHSGREVFCGDALADPLAGCHAALAGWASFRAGGGHLLDVSLCDVTAAILIDAPLAPGAGLPAGAAVAAPRMREPAAAAAPLGAAPRAVLRSLAC